MAQGISLANKCQILFGVAAVALLGAALAGPWIRTGSIVTDSQRELSRELANEILSREALDPATLTNAISGRLYRVGELIGETAALDGRERVPLGEAVLHVAYLGVLRAAPTQEVGCDAARHHADGADAREHEQRGDDAAQRGLR